MGQQLYSRFRKHAPRVVGRDDSLCLEAIDYLQRNVPLVTVEHLERCSDEFKFRGLAFLDAVGESHNHRGTVVEHHTAQAELGTPYLPRYWCWVLRGGHASSRLSSSSS